ncbi:hypothetical protein BXZ70DRAFT_889733 [Cristinia sonorae]|uniref:DUF1766-domain-containing protein n=1 Tax=Cristinia sonorae TaxID=1940300 RepID=A0A8K0XSE2_9AGAR|nr:hypothetical protein BXZ70DRAFT_889733 [Cristinia sonorae]
MQHALDDYHPGNSSDIPPSPSSHYYSGLRPPPPALPPRPYSDPPIPTKSSTTPLSTPSTGPSTPKRQKPDALAQPPQSVPAKITKANLATLNTTTKRRRAASTPPTPVSASVSGSTPGSLQCSGYTGKGERCKNKVMKGKSELAKLDPEMDEHIERYCHKHAPDVLKQTLCYVNGHPDPVKFDEWIPPYLQPTTAAPLRMTMTLPPSKKETDGYIYTFEIIDPSDKEHVHLKVGRSVNLNQRIDRWGKQCGSKEQVLRGWWPGHQDDKKSLLKGTVDPGPPGPLNHKLERLIHLELADIALNTPYLDRSWPKLKSAPAPNPKPVVRTACPDCGAVHQEIFTFKRMSGSNKGKEYDLLVKRIVAKWGSYVQQYYG